LSSARLVPNEDHTFHVDLGTIDVDLLPTATNPLLFLLVKAQGAYGELVNSTETAFVQPTWSGFEQFLSQLAIGFPGNVEARAGSMDPDSYACEVIRAERARLGLSRVDAQITLLLHSLGRSEHRELTHFRVALVNLDLQPLTKAHWVRAARVCRGGCFQIDLHGGGLE